MIPYEILFLFRVMPKPELTSALKRAANTIFQKGGIIRKLEHLGTRDMPYKISVHGVPYRSASYFLYECNIPPAKIEDILDEYNRDVDVIRRRIFKKNVPETFECTLHEECLPPPYRKDVQELIQQARRSDKPKFKYNTGLDYYPFQK
ncbi:unnamed protein product [Psylliodes chrysocephalus]|uniref:Small ribosomal subunit protein bS6m n=1 Tax=Psylliodes chrysocephalus TaxID=3402493 RepID=A0A9P0CJS3_9CUCU|nr:unnamed protein product [Psylliodes chrysocephala]